MFRFETPPNLRLSRGELMSWRQTHSVRLRVQSGLLWVTRENDLDDHILRPGDNLLLPQGRLACIGAEDESSLCFEAASLPRRVATQRRWLWLARPRTARQQAAKVPG